MKKTWMMFGFAALTLSFATMALAQDAPPPSGEEEDPTALERLKFTRPSLTKFAGVGDVPTAGSEAKVEKQFADGEEPTEEVEELPDEEDEEDPPEEPEEEPPVEDEEPPTFFGEPVSGNFVLVLDRSGSMGAVDAGGGPIEDGNGGIIANPNRITIVKAEAIKVLNLLQEDDEFAIVSFGWNPEWNWYPARVPATSGNVAAGVTTINALVASGGTPAYSALKKGCELYNDGDGLDKYYFLCDGSPNSDSGAPGGNGNASAILSAFPGWWQGGPQQSGCTMVSVHIGTSGAAGQFMQALANLTGGIYVHH